MGTLAGGAPKDVGTLGGSFSVGYALNALSQVAGESTTATGQLHAFVTQAGTGTLIDLGQQVEALAPGAVTESVAVRINDLGRVAGHYTVSTPADAQMPTQTRSFIATVGAGGNSAVLALLQNMVTLSTGVGPGESLASKAQQASMSYSANETSTSCSQLQTYASEVAALSPKPQPHSEAAPNAGISTAARRANRNPRRGLTPNG